MKTLSEDMLPKDLPFVHQEVQRIIICMSCGFYIIKMLKFYATTVSLIKFILTINNGRLMQA